MDSIITLGLSKILTSMSNIFIIVAVLAIVFSYLEKDKSRSKGLIDLGLLVAMFAGIFWAVDKLFLIG